jgi:uncharacterized protein YjbI with pentapeptide repeats
MPVTVPVTKAMIKKVAKIENKNQHLEEFFSRLSHAKSQISGTELEDCEFDDSDFSEAVLSTANLSVVHLSVVI